MKLFLFLIALLGAPVMVTQADAPAQTHAAAPKQSLTAQEVRALRMAYFELKANPVYLNEDADLAQKIKFLSELDVLKTPPEFRQAYKKMVDLVKASGSLDETDALKRRRAVLDSYFDLDDVGSHHMGMMISGYYNPQAMPTQPITIIVDEEGNERGDEEVTKRHKKAYRQQIYDRMKPLVPKIPLPGERDAMAVAYIKMRFDYRLFEIMQHQIPGGVVQPEDGVYEYPGAKYGDAYFKWWQGLEDKLDLKGCPKSFVVIINNIMRVMKDLAPMSPEERENYRAEPGLEANLPEALYLSGIPFREMDRYIHDREQKAFSEPDQKILEEEPPWPPEVLEKVKAFFLDLEKDMISKIKSGYFKYGNEFDDYYINIPGF